MIKKIVFIIILIGASFFIFKSFFEKEKENNLTFEYVEKGEGIVIFNEKKEVIFDYAINEFRIWAKENWNDLFVIPPSFGELREVDPEHFYAFNNSASLSPKQNFLAFSVNDYASLTDISFLGVINIKNGEVNLIEDYNIGGVRDIIWSSNEKYFTYILDTARGEGDYISVDDVHKRKKVFTLFPDDVAITQNGKTKNDEFLPEFRNVRWSKDDKYLYFTTNSYFEDKEEVYWRVSKEGDNLEIIE
jgi:hypothetical protein